MKRGFTLVELMIVVAIFGLAMSAAIGIFIMCQKMWHTTSLTMLANRECNMAMSRLVYGVGSNSGLRSASTLILQTNNVYGHPYPFADSNKYWETGNSPPAAADPLHYAHVDCGYGSDGSWRLTISNEFDGVCCLDYNSKMRNILFCPDTNQTSAARARRVLIGNYISAALVATNSEGANIRLTVLRKDGQFTATNQISTFVLMRNRKE